MQGHNTSRVSQEFQVFKPQIGSAFNKRLKQLFKATVGGDKYLRFAAFEQLGRWLFPGYVFSEYGRTFAEDSVFLEEFLRFSPNSCRSLDRKFAVSEFLKLVSNVPGDTVECGAFEGATSYFMCKAVLPLREAHHIFDSFAGLSSPTQEDGMYWQGGDLSAPIETIKQNLAAFPFVHYYPGWIPERFAEVASCSFSFVHLDVDLYEPTHDSLEFLYPRTNPGGVIICDDYGFSTCPGARRAMDEFFADKAESIIHMPTGQGVVIKVAHGTDSLVVR